MECAFTRYDVWCSALGPAYLFRAGEQNSSAIVVHSALPGVAQCTGNVDTSADPAHVAERHTGLALLVSHIDKPCKH
jgi:hypothetical protein